jgi:hypothetical protein
MLALRRFDQQIPCFVPLPARADSRRDGSKPWGPRHNAMRRPEDRRILTTGQSE